MKPSRSAKLLLSGLMASTLLMATSCSESASRRAIKPTMSKTNQAQSTTDISTVCTGKILTLLDDRESTKKSIEDLISQSEQQVLTQAQKDQLQSLVQDLKKKTEAASTEIQNTKSSSGKALTGCYRTNASQPSKKIIYTLSSMQVQDVQLASRVKDITKKTNDIVDQAAQDDTLKQMTTLTEKQIYSVQPALADEMSKDSIGGNMYVLSGEVHIGSNSQTELTSLFNEKKQSVCYIEAAAEQKPQADTNLTVTSIHSTTSDDKNSIEAQIVLTGKDSRIYTFKCSLPATDDVSTQLRTVFGDLIVLRSL